MPLRDRKSTWACGVVLGVLAVAAIGSHGCTRESVRVALAAQQRADQVQQTIFDRQQEGLLILLYRDLQRRLELAGSKLTEAQHTVLDEAWNERDLIEFWAVQHERARALRLIGVDAKLYSDQSVVDLLYKALSTKLDRIKLGVAAQAGERVAQEIAGNDHTE